MAKTICLCTLCGEEWMGHAYADVVCPVYCKLHRTAESRKEFDETKFVPGISDTDQYGNPRKL